FLVLTPAPDKPQRQEAFPAVDGESVRVSRKFRLWCSVVSTGIVLADVWERGKLARCRGRIKLEFVIRDNPCPWKRTPAACLHPQELVNGISATIPPNPVVEILHIRRQHHTVVAVRQREFFRNAIASKIGNGY